jgi:hypothetical protein
MTHHEPVGAVLQMANDRLYEVAVHGDVSSEHADELDRTLRASRLRNEPYLRKIARRMLRLSKLRAEVEALPDSLDRRDERIVDAHSLTAQWLAEQFEVFDERMRGVTLH